MRVLVFEWLNGGGLWLDGETPSTQCPIQKQGSSMLMAVAEDFLLSGHEVEILVDSRIELASSLAFIRTDADSPDSLRAQLTSSAKMADAILLIAPECGGCLLDVHNWLSEYSDSIISPCREFVALASDKTATAELLREKGVKVPDGEIHCEKPEQISIPFPIVVKPNDGAGSESIQVANSYAEINWPTDSVEYRIEHFIPGTPVSVSVIDTGRTARFLPPTGQRFDAQPIGHYIGAEYPLPKDIADRALSLARKCAGALPKTNGYFGIDMVIADDGPSHDCVIEVNPRLTCSYVHLRRISEQNMAELMLKRFAT